MEKYCQSSVWLLIGLFAASLALAEPLPIRKPDDAALKRDRIAMIKAIRLHRAGKPRKAFPLLERLVRTRPGWWNAHFYFALSGRLLHKPGKLLMKHVTRSLALNPRNSWAHLLAGSILLERGQAKKAVTHLRRAVRLHPSLHKARINLARAYERVKRPRQALAEYLRLLRLKDFKYRWMIRRRVARLYERINRLLESEREYRFLLQEPGYTLEARMQLYLFYKRHGMVEKAKSVLFTITPRPKPVTPPPDK